MTPTACGEYSTPTADGDNRLAILGGEKITPVAVRVTPSEADADGLTEAEGLTLAEGEIDGETLALNESDAEGESDNETLALGDNDPDGLTD